MYMYRYNTYIFTRTVYMYCNKYRSHYSTSCTVHSWYVCQQYLGQELWTQSEVSKMQ